MRTAAAYTYKAKVNAQSRLTKVQYPSGVAYTNTTLPSANCRPNYGMLSYVRNICCKNVTKPCVPLHVAGTLQGGSPMDSGTYILSGSANGIVYDAGGVYCEMCPPILQPILDGNFSSGIRLDGNGGPTILDGNR